MAYPIIKDRRSFVRGSRTVDVLTAGNYALNVTIPVLRKVEHVVQYEFYTNPTTDPGTPVNMVITRNVVGFTLMGVGAGTTITVQVLTLGV